MKKSIQLTKQDLEWAVEGDFLEKEQVPALWQGLCQHYENPLEPTTILYYVGAGLILVGSLFFIRDVWAMTKGLPLSSILFGFSLFLGVAGAQLQHQPRFKLGGTLLLLLSVCFIPVIIESCFHDADIEDFITLSAPVYKIIRLILPTLVTSLVALILWRVTAIAAYSIPLVLSLWVLILQIVAAWTGSLHIFDLSIVLPVSLGYGALLIVFGVIVDVMAEEDEAFWLYIFGALAVWLGAAPFNSLNRLDDVTFCVTNVLLIIAAILLKRYIFFILGGLGLTVYLSYLSYINLQDSMIFPLILAIIGLIFIGLGSFYKKYEAQVERFFYRLLPTSVQRILPKN